MLEIEPANTNNGQPSVNNEASAITTLQDMADADMPEVEPVPKIRNITCKVYPHEFKYITDVLDSRQAKFNQGKPLTRDMNHLLRQCLRFTLNHNKGMAFWLPDDINIVQIDT